MHFSTLFSISILLAAPLVLGQACGSGGAGAFCPSGLCCSEYSYCGSSTLYCNPQCQRAYGGAGAPAPCSPSSPSPTTTPIPTNDRCGPTFENLRCPPGQCCSEYSYCGSTPAYCNAACQKAFGGPGAPASCLPTVPSPAASSTTTPRPSTYPSVIPAIDTCGGTTGNSCAPTGPNGYFYRCCSSAGHCGPKNPIQDPALYCGTGCQPGAGKCDPATPKPSAAPLPPPAIPRAAKGETCGPIVGRVCAAGLCCSGSNFCGDTEDFCGAANWCQSGWGTCL